MFPSFKEHLRYPYLPKVAESHGSENCVTHSRRAHEAVITNDMQMTDTKQKNVPEAK